MLGLAVDGAGDWVTRGMARGARHRASWTRDIPTFPRDPARHSFGPGRVARCCSVAGAREVAASRSGCGRGLPLSGGQGGSAASAVAGAVAANALLGAPLERARPAGGVSRGGGGGRGPARGQHRAIAARRRSCWSASLEPLDVVPLPAPTGLTSCWRIRTSGCAPPTRGPCCRPRCSRDVALHQAAQVAAMVAALALRRLRAARPRDGRPHRRAGARAAPARLPRGEGRGARGGRAGRSISGSGPTAFALARGRRAARAHRLRDGGGLRRGGQSVRRPRGAGRTGGARVVEVPEAYA